MTATLKPTAQTIIGEREHTHGNFGAVSFTSQQLKSVLEEAPNWERLSSEARESLHLIQTKEARILNGNPDNVDHWRDIEGYAKLVADGLEGK